MSYRYRRSPSYDIRNADPVTCPTSRLRRAHWWGEWLLLMILYRRRTVFMILIDKSSAWSVILTVILCGLHLRILLLYWPLSHKHLNKIFNPLPTAPIALFRLGKRSCRVIRTRNIRTTWPKIDTRR